MSFYKIDLRCKCPECGNFVYYYLRGSMYGKSHPQIACSNAGCMFMEYLPAQEQLEKNSHEYYLSSKD